jgi:hypothetical protein
VTENFCYPGIESSTGSTWMGELYFNFGWLGIVVGMILLGIWFRVLQESFSHRRHDPVDARRRRDDLDARDRRRRRPARTDNT